MHDDDLIGILLQERDRICKLIEHLENQRDKIDDLISSAETIRDFLYLQSAIEVNSESVDCESVLMNPEDAIVKVDLNSESELIESIKNGSPLPINIVFAGMTFIDAVEKILSVSPKMAMHRDYVLRELYDGIVWKHQELRQTATKRLSAILNEGKNQRRWEKIPGQQCYQLIQKNK